MAQTTVTVLEQIPVAPPSEPTAEITLPLTFLDLIWLHMPPVHRLIFYHHPITKTHFKDNFIPMITNSLSLTLQHYSPLAGKVVIPPDNSILPEIRYDDGDTVPLVIAESNSGEGHFSHLTSNHARNCTDFHPLSPKLPQISRGSDGSALIHVLALQVTLFPEVGICLGVTNHHAIGDAGSIFGFMKAWAFFTSHVDKISPSVQLPPELQPFYDRTLVNDSRGLTTVFWDTIKNIKINEDTQLHPLPLITNKVRATFIVTRGDIQRLKNHILSQRPEISHVSSFTATCCYVWNSLVKSRCQTAIDNNYDLDEDEIFGCAADCRLRLDPPLPETYFGNCLTLCVGSAKAKEIVGENGLVKAADVIGETIRGQLRDKDAGVFKGAEGWFTTFATMNVDRTLSLAGSPKFDYYELDFGLGQPKKYEMPSIDMTGAISLSKAKDDEGGMEVGLSLPVTQMETFTRIFPEGLEASF